MEETRFVKNQDETDSLTERYLGYKNMAINFKFQRVSYKRIIFHYYTKERERENISGKQICLNIDIKTCFWFVKLLWKCTITDVTLYFKVEIM